MKSKVLELFKRIQNFRSEGALTYYMKIFGVSREIAEDHFIEMLKFLSISVYYEGVTPSDQVDEMWHSMIIQTKSYQELSTLMGKFVHHETTEKPQVPRYQRTLDLYEEIFINVHEIWTKPPLEKVKLELHHIGDGECKECQIAGWCHCPSGFGVSYK